MNVPQVTQEMADDLIELMLWDDVDDWDEYRGSLSWAEFFREIAAKLEEP